MRYVVAVSGGVDSVVLLDMLAQKGEHDLVVAHFDHGIRDDSASDARFVRALAGRYGLPFETKREELGPAASEDTGRRRRYEFLRDVASRHDGKIATAHHGDDVIESIIINLTRGTGWRGLAVMNDPQVERPLLALRKAEIYEYAVTHGLEWMHDETNSSTKYLRNRVRSRAAGIDEKTRSTLLRLWQNQRELAYAVDTEADRHSCFSRYFMTMIDDDIAVELLRHELERNRVSLTRPRRKRLLHAVKTAQAGSRYEAGDRIEVSFTASEFIVKYP